MANQKKVDEQDKQVLDEEKELLKSQVEELKNMVQMMMEKMSSQNPSQNVEENKDTTKRDKNEKFYDIEEELDISPTSRVKLVSLTVGGLNLRCLHHIVSIPEFGQSISVSFEDLRHIVNNHSTLTREGAFMIVNEKAVKALYLERDYEKLMSRGDIEHIVNLQPDQIYTSLMRSTKAQIQAIVHQFIRGIIDGDQRYLDHNKLRVISDYVGSDIYQLSTELR